MVGTCTCLVSLWPNRPKSQGDLRENARNAGNIRVNSPAGHLGKWDKTPSVGENGSGPCRFGRSKVSPVVVAGDAIRYD